MDDPNSLVPDDAVPTDYSGTVFQDLQFTDLNQTISPGPLTFGGSTAQQHLGEPAVSGSAASSSRLQGMQPPMPSPGTPQRQGPMIRAQSYGGRSAPFSPDAVRRSSTRRVRSRSQGLGCLLMIVGILLINGLVALGPGGVAVGAVLVMVGVIAVLAGHIHSNPVR